MLRKQWNFVNPGYYQHSPPSFLISDSIDNAQNKQVMRGSTQREALPTNSVEKNLEQTFPIVTPQYWCQNDRTDESFQIVCHLNRSDTIMVVLTRI